MTDHESTSGTTRRAFLGAAGTAAALAATGTTAASADATNDSETEENAEPSFSASIQLYENFEDPADYSLSVSSLTDEHTDVELNIDTGIGYVSMGFSQSEAAAFADELVAAARRGNDGLGE
ncbi:MULTISPECIES: hypothetical protein [Halobacterium]|uniref:hypothetical protein n=1 Tax=Halobacterium TaxID=2239 RepID=UPI00073EABF6|nr:MULTISPECIES: hypothetical protein [Halobacterium]MCG1004885.1 hypothetical protein [Halobacterium noricense]